MLFSELRFRLRSIFRRASAEAELQEELRQHLELEAAKYRERGLDVISSAHHARIALGNRESTLEACRDERGARWLDDFFRDLRQGARMLLRSPAFALTAIASLALGIGANTAVFAVIDAVILKPLPVLQPDRLVMIWETMPCRGAKHNVISPGNLRDWRNQSASFTQMEGIDLAIANLTGVETPREVHGQFATAGLFSLLGAQPGFGRTFTDEEARQKTRAIVLSDRFARLRFGSPDAAVGKSLELDREPWQVIGVMPPGFEFLDADCEFWRPYYLNPATDYRHNQGRFMRAIARLKPGVTMAQAEAELRGIAAQLEIAWPDFDKGWSVELTQYREEVSGNYRTPLYFLMGAVAFVMLIACVNVANLLFARAGARRRELGIRTSLGAGSGRLVRQMLAESLLLAALGSVPGCLMALAGLAVFRNVAPPSLHGLAAVGFDWRMIAFTGLLSLTATLLFGIGPALLSTRDAPVTALHEGGRNTGRGWRLSGALVAVELALAVVLVVGSGLLIKSFQTLRSVDTGFVAERVLTARILLPPSYDDAKTEAFFAAAAEKLNALPGVTSSSAVSFMPFGGLRPATRFTIAGRPEPPKDQRPVTQVRSVRPAYFRTLGIPFLKGRDFNEGEGTPDRPALIVNNALARQQFPDENPVGRVMTVVMGRRPMPGVIVGVVADTRDKQLDGESLPTVYYSQSSLPIGYMSLVVRTTGDPASLGRAVLQIVHAIDPNQPVMDVQPLDEMLSRSLSPQRFQAILLAAFAGIALLLAAVGIYGVSAYAVTQRTNEIGIRMALGATRGQVVGLITKQGSGMIGTGLVLGLAAAFALRTTIASFLYGVAPSDLTIYATAVAVLVLVALLAIIGPARRAAGIDPVSAVRAE